MPVQWQIIDVPLGGGVNEAVDQFVLSQEVMAGSELVNVRFDKDGHWAKRWGHSILNASITNIAHSLFAHGSGLLRLNYEGLIERYVEAFDRWQVWTPPDDTLAEQPPVMPIESARHQVIDNVGVDMADLAVGHGCICYVWVTTSDNKAYAKVVDATTRATVLPTRELTQASKSWERIRVVATANVFIIVAQDLAGGGLYSWIGNFSSAIPNGWTAKGQVTASPGPFDFIAVPLAQASAFKGPAFLLYEDGVGNSVVDPIDETGLSAGSARTITGEATSFAVQVDVNKTQVIAITGDNAYGTARIGITVIDGNLMTITAGPTRGPVLTGLTVNQAGVSVATGGFWVVWEEHQSTGVSRVVLNARKYKETGGAISPVTTTHQSFNVRMTAKPVLATTNRILVPVHHDPRSGGAAVSAVQPTGMLLAIANVDATKAGNETFMPVSHFGIDEIEQRPLVQTSIGDTQALGTSALWVAGAFPVNLDASAVIEYAANLDPVPLKTFERDGATYISGGHLSVFDGELPHESAPSWRPSDLTATLPGSGGSLSAGSYQWIAVWEWEDAAGALHRSATSNVFQATAAANDSAVLKLADLSIRGRHSVRTPPVVALYRTQANGTVFNLVSRSVWSASAVLGEVTLTDTAADSSILANELLYTEGGVLDAELPPPFLDVAVTNDRVWGLHAELRSQLWPSKLLQEAISPEFNGALFVQLPEDGTALSVMDGNVIAFSEHSIFRVGGAGPVNTGAGPDFIGPERITSPVGCINRASVVSMDAGVMFESHRGLEILTRGGEVKHLGKPMMDTIQSFRDAGDEIVAAVHVAREQEIRFYYDNGKALVFNTTFGRWSRHDLSGTPVDVTMVGSDLYWAEISATHKETPGLYDDGTAHVPLTVATPWISVSSRQGLGHLRRILLAGESLESHELTVKLRYDRIDSDVDTFSSTAAQLAALTRYQWEFRPSRRKIQSVKMVIIDAGVSGGASDGPVFSLLGVEVGATPLGRRIETAARNP